MTMTYWTQRITTCFAVIAVLAGTSGFNAQPLLAQDNHQQYTIEQFLKTVSYSGASFSPDNTKILLSSNESGVFNAYEVTIADGSTKQLTNSDVDSIFAIGYFPEDERFLYTADQGGNELNHLFVQLQDGSQKDLTPGENLKAQFAGWAHDDKSFYAATNERDPKYFCLLYTSPSPRDRQKSRMPSSA